LLVHLKKGRVNHLLARGKVVYAGGSHIPLVWGVGRSSQENAN
jgi:hypothetical protein